MYTENTLEKLCWLCDRPLTDSKEHVFPKGVGGTKTVSGFICKKCNNDTGSQWDKHLLQLLVFNRIEHGLIDSVSAALDAVSQEGVDGHRRFKMFGFRDVRVSDTTTDVSENPDGSLNVNVSAGNLKALKRALKGLKRKYPQLEDVDVTQSVSTGNGSQIGKLNSTVALMYLALKNPSSRPLWRGHSPQGPILGIANLATTICVGLPCSVPGKSLG